MADPLLKQHVIIRKEIITLLAKQEAASYRPASIRVSINDAEKNQQQGTQINKLIKKTTLLRMDNSKRKISQQSLVGNFSIYYKIQNLILEKWLVVQNLRRGLWKQSMF